MVLAMIRWGRLVW
jgi:hypothetical protein